MIKTLKVDNFKSLVGFSMELHGNNVIVGNNATGKSTILQAIDFMCSSVKEDYSIILERRGWTIEHIKSKLTPEDYNKISFATTHVLEVEGQELEFEWEMVVTVNSSKNEILLDSEKVMACGEELLYYTHEKGGLIRTCDAENKVLVLPQGLYFHSSVMKAMKDSDMISERLRVLIAFLKNSLSFELLSPSEMRLSSRGAAENIGISGKDLSSFVNQMNESQKNAYMKKLTYILGDKIQKVDTRIVGEEGKAELFIEEVFQNSYMKISSKEMSDGMLRLLAFIAISELQTPEAVVLMDEVENGINVDYAKHLLEVMQSMYTEKKHQLIITTHSTVFLDYVDANDIICLYRDENGFTQAKHIFEEAYFRDKLEYMWPGEVFLSMSQRELVEKMLSVQEA